MRKKWQTFLSIALYIIILTCTLDFNILRLINIQLMLLVLFGTLILTIPFYEKGIKRAELAYIFGRKAIEAGFIQTFLLLFARLQNEKSYDGLLGDIALCFRPLLYGFCLLVLLSEKTESRPEAASKSEPVSAQPDLENADCEYHTDPAGDNCREIFNLQDFTKIYGLTKRETEITQLITQGKSNAEIAEELFISEKTVKKHVSNIFDKTGVNKREELIIKIRIE